MPLSPKQDAPISLGFSAAHHGELVQGVYADGDDAVSALVTLPCGRFRSKALFAPGDGPLRVHPAGRRYVEAAVAKLVDRYPDVSQKGALFLSSTVPVSWGMGSSTADIVATLRALGSASGREIETDDLAAISVAAEGASDSIMYSPEEVRIFAHREGRVLEHLAGPLPPMLVVGFTDAGDAVVETEKVRVPEYDATELASFREAFALVRNGVADGDPEPVAHAATRSAEINQRYLPKRLYDAARELGERHGALGIQVAHSGIVLGLLFRSNAPATALTASVAGIEAAGGRISTIFTTDEDSQCA